MIDHHPERAGYDAVLERHPHRLRRDLDDPDRVPARRRARAPAEARHRAPLRHQERHAAPRPRHEPRRPRRLRLPCTRCTARRCCAASSGRRCRGPGCTRSAARSRAPSVEDGIHLLVLGRVREDVIPQVADLGLQAEGAEWAVAAGHRRLRPRVLGAQRRLRARRGRGRARGRRGPRRRRRPPLDGEGHRPAQGVPQGPRPRRPATIRRALLEAFAKAIHSEARA